MDKQIIVSPPPQVPRQGPAAGSPVSPGEPRTKTAADEAGPVRRRVRDPVRDHRSRPEQPRLVFSPLAWMKLMLLMHAGDTEVGCFGVSSATDPLYVEDLSVPKQYTSMVTVRFDDESVADHFDRMADRGVGPARCGRVWVHTHPGGSATPSSIDEETTYTTGALSVDELVPCGESWKSHGQYLSAVKQVAEAFLEAGLITEDQKKQIIDAAANSDCGR